MSEIKQVSSKQEIIDGENEANKFDINNMSNPSEILYNVVNIKKDLQDKNKEYVKDKYKEFIEKYPFLFDKLMSGTELTELFEMLKLMNQIKQGGMDYNTASERVGYSMADKYLPDHLKKQTNNYKK